MEQGDWSHCQAPRTSASATTAQDPFGQDHASSAAGLAKGEELTQDTSTLETRPSSRAAQELDLMAWGGSGFVPARSGMEAQTAPARLPGRGRRSNKGRERNGRLLGDREGGSGNRWRTAGARGVSAVFCLVKSVMRQSSTIRQRLAGIGLVGLPLPSFPLVSLPVGEFAGLPATYCYLFWRLALPHRFGGLGFRA